MSADALARVQEFHSGQVDDDSMARRRRIALLSAARGVVHAAAEFARSNQFANECREISMADTFGAELASYLDDLLRATDVEQCDDCGGPLDDLGRCRWECGQ